MKKIYTLQNLDCAHCASLMEIGIKKIDGVTDASVNFITQKLTITADDDRLDEIMQTVRKTCRKIEPDCIILDEPRRNTAGKNP